MIRIARLPQADFHICGGPSVRVANPTMYGGDDGARTRDLCRDIFTFQISQRLTRPMGTPNSTETVEGTRFCGLGCGSV